ncbi:MAG: YceI family protein [Bacteroidales bacterium]|jgi:polyisoprenoid-binding protein YceI|nr:YceI family protein [Bacteroidales bacterium]
MKQILNTIWIVTILTVSFPLVSCSQSNAELLLPESQVSVRGTSSMHDWEVSFGKYEVNFAVSNTDNGKMSISNVKAVFSGASVTSDNKIMTGKARDALMVNDHPDIVFVSGGAESVINNDGKITGTMKGKLQIGGITRPIDISFSGNINGDRISITGSEEVNMADYGIKPPTALLGALKTGEEVTVELRLSFLVPGANLANN